MRNTIFNAGANLLRSEGEEEIPLFNEEDREEDIEKVLQEREALFGKSNT